MSIEIPTDIVKKKTRSKATLEREECEMCSEFINKSSHKKIECPHCASRYCLSCIKLWLLTSKIKHETLPICMNPLCGKEWNDDFLSKSTSKAFFDGEFASHRAEIQMVYEMSLLPMTMRLAEVEKKKKNYKIELRKVKENLRQINYERRQRINEVNRLQYFLDNGIELNSGTRDNNIDSNSDTSLGIQCVQADCNGYLRNWICGLCERGVCSKCRCSSDGDEEHVCKEDDLASAAAILKDTKPCPKCGTRIYKIGGCDHFFCPRADCLASFDWYTGNILRPNENTNPLYYEWRRTRGFRAREIGDVPCGGLPNFIRFLDVFGEYDADIEFGAEIFVSHSRNISVEIRKYRVIDLPRVNETLRIKYLLGDIKKTEWISQLKSAYKLRQKNVEVFEILDNHNSIMTDIIIEIGDREVSRERFEELLVILNNLKDYTNTNLENVRKRFNLVVPQIFKNWLINSDTFSRQSVETRKDNDYDIGVLLQRYDKHIDEAIKEMRRREGIDENVEDDEDSEDDS